MRNVVRTKEPPVSMCKREIAVVFIRVRVKSVNMHSTWSEVVQQKIKGKKTRHTHTDQKGNKTEEWESRVNA